MTFLELNNNFYWVLMSSSSFLGDSYRSKVPPFITLFLRLLMSSL